MNSTIMYFISMLPIITVVNFIFNQKHLLMTLLSIEGIMLSLVMLIPMLNSMFNMVNASMSIILLSLGACEASLGLSLLVMMSRSYGSDLLKLLTMNKC